MTATAMVGKTCTVSDAEKNGENKFECRSRSILMSKKVLRKRQLDPPLPEHFFCLQTISRTGLCS